MYDPPMDPLCRHENARIVECFQETVYNNFQTGKRVKGPAHLVWVQVYCKECGLDTLYTSAHLPMFVQQLRIRAHKRGGK